MYIKPPLTIHLPHSLRVYRSVIYPSYMSIHSGNHRIKNTLTA